VQNGTCSIQHVHDHEHLSEEDQYQIFDTKYCKKQVTGIRLESVQCNLTQTSVPQKEDNVFLIKFNLECSGLFW